MFRPVVSLSHATKSYRVNRPLGKITVLKSLIASQLVYILPSPLPTTESYSYGRRDQQHLLQFSLGWKKGRDKIKRDFIISEYKNGGLKMIDIKSFNKTL